MTKYSELKGVFKAKDEIASCFTVALGGGRAAWGRRLDYKEIRSEYSESSLKFHFEANHDSLSLPIEFIT